MFMFSRADSEIKAKVYKCKNINTKELEFSDVTDRFETASSICSEKLNACIFKYLRIFLEEFS